jgi:phosphate transport system substrate-binding protein
MRNASLFLLAGLIACSPEKKDESTTRGNLKLLIGESVAPPIVAEVDEFLRLYHEGGAKITYSVVSSERANSLFVLDSVRTIITAIPLVEKDRKTVKDLPKDFVEIVLAYDGVVAVVHATNPRTQMTLEQIRDILKGAITKWEQLGGTKKIRGKIRLVLEDSSDATSYLSRRLLNGNDIQAGLRRTSSSLQTLQYVAKDPLSLGFVGLSWVDSAKTGAKILELAANPATVDTQYVPTMESIGNFYRPHPAHLYRNYYPMKRAIYVYSRSARGNLATGFTTFLATLEGQQIFLQKNLLPATQKIRLKPSF